MKKATIFRSLSATFGIIAIFLFILSSCTNTSKNQEGDADSLIVDEDKEIMIEELSGYPLPTAYEITELVYNAGAPYTLSLSNDPAKAEEYITQRDKALNLGVYGTNLCYASTHGMKHPTMLYFPIFQ